MKFKPLFDKVAIKSPHSSIMLIYIRPGSAVRATWSLSESETTHTSIFFFTPKEARSEVLFLFSCVSGKFYPRRHEMLFMVRIFGFLVFESGVFVIRHDVTITTILCL